MGKTNYFNPIVLNETELFRVAKSTGFATLSSLDMEVMFQDFRSEVLALCADVEDNNIQTCREISNAITELEFIASIKKYS